MASSPDTGAPRALIVWSRNATFAAMSSGSSLLLLWLLVLVARRFGPDVNGQFLWILNLAVVFETLTDFGLREVSTRAIARARQVAPHYFSHVIGLKLAISVAVLGLLVAIVSGLRPEPDVRLAAVLVGAGSLLRSYMTTSRGVFYGLERFDLETAVLVVDRVLLLTIGSAALAAGVGLVGFGLAFFAARAVATVMSFILTRRVLGTVAIGVDLRVWKELQSAAIPFGVFGVVLQLYNYVDGIMLGIMRTDAETGYYGNAYRFYEGFSHIPSIIAVVLIPRLSREFVVNRAKYLRLARAGVSLALVLALPCSAVAWWIGPAAVSWLFAGSLPAGPVIQTLGLGFVVVFPLAVLGAVATAADAERLLVRTATVGCLVNIALNLWLIPRHGIIGAALATVIGEMISLVMLFSGLGWRLRADAPRPPGAS